MIKTLSFSLGILLLVSCASTINLFSMDRQKALYLATSVYDLCTEYMCSVTSWIRTPFRNDLVGGVPNSKHLQGLAVDVVLDDRSSQKMFLRAVKDKNLRAIVEKDHIHIYIEVE